MQRNYRHTKDVLRHSAVYKKRKKAKFVKLIILAILLLCAFIGLILLVRISTFTISEIQIKGLQSANTQDVINEVEMEVAGNYALVFPRKNIFFYPKDKIREELLNKFKTFADAEIKIVDTNKLEVAIVEKNANAVSCQSEDSIIEGTFSNCFFIDASAHAFQAVVGEPDQSLTRYVDIGVNTASSTLSADMIVEINKVKANLSDKNLVTGFIKVIDSKTVEFHILNNGKIIISLPVGEDFLSILGAALGTKMLAGNVIFDYVDARFGNKVFFKLHDGNTVNSLNTASTTASASSTTKAKSLTVTKATSTKSTSTIRSIKTKASTSTTASKATTSRVQNKKR
jgi:hypothetical protein